MRVIFIFVPYGFWIGVNWDTSKRELHILPVPCFGVKLKFKKVIVSPPEAANDNYELRT